MARTEEAIQSGGTAGGAVVDAWRYQSRHLTCYATASNEFVRHGQFTQEPEHLFGFTPKPTLYDATVTRITPPTLGWSGAITAPWVAQLPRDAAALKRQLDAAFPQVTKESQADLQFNAVATLLESGLADSTLTDACVTVLRDNPGTTSTESASTLTLSRTFAYGERRDIRIDTKRHAFTSSTRTLTAPHGPLPTGTVMYATTITATTDQAALPAELHH